MPTLSLTETQTFTALRSFLLSATLPNTEVIQAQINRVPEPLNADFIVMTPLRQERLETNETTYADNILLGSIAATVLTVTSIPRAITPLAAGMTLVDTSAPTNIAPNTAIVAQLTGPVGGAGTYTVTPTQTVAQEPIYAGVRSDFVATKFAVQLDIHGPNSSDNARCIDTLFRSEYGTDQFGTSGFAMAPLYCEDARQMTFINDQQQYEDRWVMEVCLQINPVVGTQQSFAQELAVTTIEAAPVYTGP